MAAFSKKYNIGCFGPPALSVLAQAPQKANISSHFHPFFGHMGADVGFLKAIYDFGQQFFAKSLSISVSGRQKANIELTQVWQGCLRRDLSAAGFVCSGVYLQSEPAAKKAAGFCSALCALL